jgi:hypothetical protein
MCERWAAGFPIMARLARVVARRGNRRQQPFFADDGYRSDKKTKAVRGRKLSKFPRYLGGVSPEFNRRDRSTADNPKTG